MPKLRVHNLAISLDGYIAGPDQSLDHPLGVGGMRLHDWAFATRSFHQMNGTDGGESGLDDSFIAQGDAGVGATIMGRNMFGPIRGAWGGDEWRGWWGDNPPYHHPVYVLTHRPRPSIPMQGGTTFHLSTAVSKRRWSEFSRPPTELTSGSAVARPQFSSTFAQA
jgi:dihydrofolate reductase